MYLFIMNLGKIVFSKKCQIVCLLIIGSVLKWLCVIDLVFFLVLFSILDSFVEKK
ncbi:type III secretory pathway component EscU [Flavobacterium sp. 7A]|nr:type III secretory pathway component EscU [Flavobacterium sp. 7A]